MPDFEYQPVFEHGHSEVPYRRLTEASVTSRPLISAGAS